MNLHSLEVDGGFLLCLLAGADTADLMSAGTAARGRDTLLAMAANPLIMPRVHVESGPLLTFNWYMSSAVDVYSNN